MRLVVCKVAEFVKNNEIAQVNFVPREQAALLGCFAGAERAGCGQREQKALLHNLSPH
jgi:hypothetical protein